MRLLRFQVSGFMFQDGGRSGSVLMEFSMCFPIVLILICACVEFSQLSLAKLTTHYAAYCAARAALVTVCDAQGPSTDNDSWPTRQELPYEGLKDPFTQLGSIAAGRQGEAQSEAEWAGCKAAEEVCAWSVLGGRGDSMKDQKIPGWGRIPGTDAAERKVRATVTFQGWNVQATVEQDFALVMPIIGPMLAWAMNPWDPLKPWAEQSKDPTDNVHRYLDRVGYPHLRVQSTVWMSKPYITDIAAGNWMGAPPQSKGRSGW